MKSSLQMSTSCYKVSHPRSGVTLVEVLMSLLIMGIGVSSLITLFPISAKRVIEATNMTNATVLRFNAEAVIDSQPGLVFDPDSNLITKHLGENYLVDPLGFTVLQASGISSAPPVPGPIGAAWVFGYNAPGSVTVPLPMRYPGVASGAGSLVQSVPANWSAAEDAARTLVTSRDTFSDQGDGRAVVGSAAPVGGFTSVTLDPNVDLSALQGLNLTQVRIRANIFDPSGDRSEVRDLTSISQPAPHILTWTTPLPSNFTDVGRVMVASGEEFYTWMLSVHRRASGPAKVDVVVFVKRLLTQAAEQVYSAKLVRFVPGTSNENGQVTIDFTGLEKPTVKRGGYLFDTKNCHWYRVTAIVSETTTTVSVVLEESIRKDNTEDLNKNGVLDPKEDSNNNGLMDSGEDTNGNGRLDLAEDANGNGTIDEGGVIVVKGVVGVFPLELKLP